MLPWYSRFDGGLPIIDVSGYALKALEHVRHNDPTGELADDAAIQIAEYYIRNHHDYESAAMYYDQFIAEYAKSPYLQKVQHAAIDARLKGYLGPEYDSSGLEKARELVKKTMATFPEQQASYEGLYHTLDVINNAEAEKTFLTGELLQTRQQGCIRRVLFRQDPPAVAQQSLGRQGQGRAGSTCQDAPNAVEAQQDHDPARLDQSVWRRWRPNGRHGHGWHGYGRHGYGRHGYGRHGWYGWNDVKGDAMKDVLNQRSRLLGSRERAVPPALGNARRLMALLSTAVLLSLAGCGSFGRSPSTSSEGGFFGWHFYAPFDTSEVKTVAVFFKTNSFRRDIEKQLTEAVEKEINLRTPFKLVT